MREIGITLAREQESERTDQRHRDERDRGELRVHDEEDDRDADDHHHATGSLHHPPADEVADRIEVVGRARDDLAGGVAVVERARVAQVRLVEQLAHPRFDADADARGRVPAREVGQEPEDREADDRDEVGPERSWWPFVGTIELSIACRTRIGIASASAL